MPSASHRARASRALSSPAARLRPLVTALALAGALPSVALAQAEPVPGGAAQASNLPQVTVRAESTPDQSPPPYAGGQVARGGRLGILGNQDMMDVPFSITAYTAETMQNQQARSIADVLANDPGVRSSLGFGNFSETFVVRGFQLTGDDIAYNGLYGIAPRQLVAVEGLDRVEIFKGASAFLNGVTPGGSGIGGGINLQPKFATAQPITQATLDYTSDAQVGGHVDIGRRFADNRIGVRINALARGGDAAVDNEHRNQRLFTAGIDYQGDRFRISGDFGYQKQTVNQGRSTVNLTNGIIPPVPSSTTNVAQPWANTMLEDTYGTIRAEYDFAPAWTAYVGLGAHHINEYGNYSSPRVAGNGFGTASRLTVPYKGDNTAQEVGVRGIFHTGPVKHQLNVAWSGTQTEKATAFESSASFPTNLYNGAPVPRPATSSSSGNMADPGVTGRTNLSSFAVSDTVSFLQDRVLITAGVRQQNIKVRGYSYTGVQTADYDESATSPAFGLVVKPVQNVSLYVNHIEGLAQGPTAPSTADNRNEVFAPIKSKQNEAGVKWDAGKFGTTLAVYQIEQPTGVTQNNVFSIAGEQRNRGVELSGFGEPVRGVRLLAGIAYIDTKLSGTANGANDGNRAVGVPNYTLNVGAEWDLPWLAGLTVTGRYLQTGRQYQDVANRASLPSWNRFDLGARYRFKAAQQRYTIRAAIENVADKDYWASSYGGYLVQGAPRTFKVAMTVDF
ncbi:TonB-dependent siderophore receptor [Cupriavidus respiraculi]|uniref:Ferrichrome receptor FcuA n=1 Tax=Cupriavidus respiraculi TaxID=195930 RepID=A0ABM8WM98_9BURK|nr:TonB-dependent siderophore receptor [Cupriavidus respiraculi]CAG9168503.1 Ferrichrome receptor FcuA [Cupriavidus respiraculi]